MQRSSFIPALVLTVLGFAALPGLSGAQSGFGKLDPAQPLGITVSDLKKKLGEP